MLKTTVNVEGMACGMCEAHVCDAIRKALPEAKKVSASHGKKVASFITCLLYTSDAADEL